MISSLNPINIMAPARRSIRATVTKTQQEPVAQTRASRATKPALVAKIAEEATTIIEEEQAAQEPPVSNTRVSRSRRSRQVPKPVESEMSQHAAQAAIPRAGRGRRGRQQEIEEPATTKPPAVAQKSSPKRVRQPAESAFIRKVCSKTH